MHEKAIGDFLSAIHGCVTSDMQPWIGMMGVSRKPNSRDVEIGRELARTRKSAGLSQAAMAAALGISTQQYGKYERGENRISTSRHEEALEFLRAAQGHSQPGLSEERVRYQGPEALHPELENAALALQQALERFLATVRRLAPARGSQR